MWGSAFGEAEGRWEAGSSNGNGGNQATVDALEGWMRLKPRADHRFTVQHYGMSTPEMARKLARLAGVASVNPYYIYARSEFSVPYAYTAARLRSLVDAGVPTAMHTDSPVVSPLHLEEVWISVNRFGLSGRVPRTRRAHHRRPNAANGHHRRRAQPRRGGQGRQHRHWKIR